MIILDKSIKIILMDKDNNGKDLHALNNRAMQVLAGAFGGVTTTPAAGAWIDNGKTYIDKSHIYQCNFSALDAEKISAVIETVKMEFLDGGQFAVSVEIGGALIVIEKSELADGLKDFKKSLKKLASEKFIA